ncbi:MAG TPA: hypothetical protein EYP74_02355 [Anaerolineales bacterium]|nr:hypothetical protein [Anaerolineales bacterium]
MLVIISDLHLGDGTCGKPIKPSAFRLFETRLKDLAYNASWRTNGKYRPISEINILWLGDILDLIHSTNWLDTKYGADDYTRPWTDNSAPIFLKKTREITREILKNNRHAVDAIYNITRNNAIMIPPAIGDGQPDPTAKEKHVVKVNIYYMLGNHDWIYHLPGEGFDEVRQEIIEAFGLANDKSPFPHDIEESPALAKLLAQYKVYARHGDIFSPFTYNKEKGRNASTLSDAFSLEVVSRFPFEVEKEFEDNIIFKNLHYLSNVRPLLASPIWAISQITSDELSPSEQKKIRKLWDETVRDFFVLQRKYFPLSPLLQTLLQTLFFLLINFPFSTYTNIALWFYRYFWKDGGYSLVEYALKEPAFLEKKATQLFEVIRN